MKSLRAFTLIEVVIIVAILGISITLVTAWTLRILNSAELQTSYESLLGTLRKSQSAALSSVSGSAHGIRFTSNDYMTFVGSTFDSSDPDTRVTFELPPRIELTTISLNGEVNDLIFDRGTGETSQYGTLILDYLPESQPYTITISSLGLID